MIKITKEKNGYFFSFYSSDRGRKAIYKSKRFNTKAEASRIADKIFYSIVRMIDDQKEVVDATGEGVDKRKASDFSQEDYSLPQSKQ